MEQQIQINLDKLQQLQDSYSAAAHVFVFCVDENGRKLTNLSGDVGEAKRVITTLPQEKLAEMLERVMGSRLEEQIVEPTTVPYIRAACISVKIADKPVLNWIIYAVLEDGKGLYRSTTTAEGFERSLELLRVGSRVIFENRMQAIQAQLEFERSRSTEMEMALSLKKSRALTEIVQCFESNDPIEDVVDHVLKITGQVMGLSNILVIRARGEGEKTDVVGEYIAPDAQNFYPVRKGVIMPEFAVGVERTVAISTDTRVSQMMREKMARWGVEAAIMTPIMIRGNNAMTALFLENRRLRSWNVEEIRFLSEIGKILQEMIERRIQKNSLASSFASLERIMENMGSLVFVVERGTGQVLFSNLNLQSRYLGCVKDKPLENEFLASINDEFDLPNQFDQQEMSPYLEVYDVEQEFWYDLHRTKMRWVDGRDVLLYSLYDISEKKQYQGRIEQQANNDFLTGLYNRMSCERDLKNLIEESKNDGTRGALLYLDLDDFKHINDGLGHQYGDVLLQSISHSFQRIEGIQDTCYRMGGDEFVILIRPEFMNQEDRIIRELREIFAKPWFLKGADYYCTMSMGVVSFPDEGETVQELIRKADIAMYEAKRTGKNKVANFSANSDSLAFKRLGMEQSMRTATATPNGFQEFEVYYQPIVDVTKPGNPCVGAEALLRWNNAELGMISPADFIPLAEYLGLINPIGNYVLKKACEACHYWNRNGHPYYKVNVNLSVVQLLQEDIVESVAKVIEETGINPRNLTLEVTESLAINDMARMKEVISRIRNLGARIALDDFGTGYSSLNHIREIPLDVIKVDQSFVRDLAVNQYSQSFIKMVSELAETLDVKVCVEGIEETSQIEVLRNMKIRMIQGYYFGKPMPLPVFEAKYVDERPEDK